MKKIIHGILLVLAGLLVLSSGCALPAGDVLDYSKMFGDETFDYGIAFYGDTGKHHLVHHNAVKNIFAFDPLAVFHLGDAVRDGADSLQWAQFDCITSNLREDVAFYPAIGNHEKGVDPEWYAAHWDVPIGQGYYSLNLYADGRLSHIPISDSGSSTYTDDLKINAKVHLVVLHSNPEFLLKDGEQYNWLIEDLLEYQDFPIILLFHIPLYCAGIHSSEMGDLHPADVLYDLLQDERFNIIACINGHDHAYERFQVNGTYHICTGCAGESPYDIYQDDHPYLQVYEAVHHISIMKFFLDMEGEDDYIQFTAFDLDFNIIDTIKIVL